MSITNKFSIVKGYIGSDITEVTPTRKTCMVKISVASTELGISGKPVTDWFQCIVFGDLARALVEQKRIIKGNDIMVIGNPQNRKVILKDGKSIMSTDIRVLELVTGPKIFTSSKAKDDLEKAKAIDENITEEQVGYLDEGVV